MQKTSEEIKALCESVRAKLKEAVTLLETFLNDFSLSRLNPGNDPVMDEFYRGYLSDMRHLLVFSEVVYEKLGQALRRPQFNADQAERALYDVYHQCVNRFFYPQHECYSEDARYAYSGQDSIKFRKKPCREVRDLTVALAGIFDPLREELSYYETEYIHQKRLRGERV